MVGGATLRAERLCIAREGRRVVHDASFVLSPGQITALLGANGAGKSSLVLGLAGAIPVESGAVHIGDTQLNGLDGAAVRRNGVALVPEGHRVLSEMTVEENLLVAGTSAGRAARRKGLEHVYAVLPELIERRRQRAGALSGGQKQMVAFGHALMSRPAYMIVDELSLGLAPTIVKRLVDVLAALREQGVAILLIEQFAELALRISDHVLVMERGRLSFDGSARDLEKRPEILHTAYLASPAR